MRRTEPRSAEPVKPCPTRYAGCVRSVSFDGGQYRADRATPSAVVNMTTCERSTLVSFTLVCLLPWIPLGQRFCGEPLLTLLLPKASRPTTSSPGDPQIHVPPWRRIWISS